MPKGVETLEFQAQTRRLLRLLINTIYADRDIFLRELLSNAADALAKARFQAHRGENLDLDTTDLRITIEVNRDNRTLTVIDNGIGMTYAEVIEVLGTIAKSGTAELLISAKRSGQTSAASPGLIGQFGVGFYSTFMVADTVVMVTRRAGARRGVRWESHGDGTYTVASVDDAPQGTSVTLRLKPDRGGAETFGVYLTGWKIRQIVRRYCDFLPWPIRMQTSHRPAAGEGDGPASHDSPINSMTALWSLPRGAVADAEYHDLYRRISHDWTEPLVTLTLRGDDALEYHAVLFIPSQAPAESLARNTRRGPRLYVRRVQVLDNCDSLMPGYLRFIRGVVDAEDLALNLSGEAIQQDRRLHTIRRTLVKKVLSSLQEIMADDPDRFRRVWHEFGAVLKEGVVVDQDNRSTILDLLHFQSTMDSDRPTTLRAYVERMAADQDAIYYLLGESRATVEHSPHLEALSERGYEVLLLTDRIDPLIVDTIEEFAGKPLRSAATAEISTGQDGGPPEPGQQGNRQQYVDLLPWMATVLGDHVTDVRLSERLTTSAARLVSDQSDSAVAWERSYIANVRMPRGPRILELNPEHELVHGLRTAFASCMGEPDTDIVEVVELLHSVALIADGADLHDPSRFARLVSSRLARTL